MEILVPIGVLVASGVFDACVVVINVKSMSVTVVCPLFGPCRVVHLAQTMAPLNLETTKDPIDLKAILFICTLLYYEKYMTKYKTAEIFAKTPPPYTLC